MKKNLSRLGLAAVVVWGSAIADLKAQVVFTNAAPFLNPFKIRGCAIVSIRTNTSTPGSYTVTGGGNDIGGTNDEFTFHCFSNPALAGYPSVADFRVRVSSLEPDSAWTKAGLMMRESTNGNSRM